jgi:hypothetical protein
MNLHLCLALLTVPACAHAAILVGPTGSGTLTFTNPPVAAEWATGELEGSASTFFSEAALEAAVQNLAVGGVTNSLPWNSANPPTSFRQAQWNSALEALSTRPAGSGAALLLARIQNNTGFDLSRLYVSYDFAEYVSPGFVTELPGYRVFYSRTGNAGDWQAATNLSGRVDAGRHAAALDVTWPASALVYVLWVDDNANNTSDPAYTTDNVVFSPQLPPPCITFPPTNATVVEGNALTLSAQSCAITEAVHQWFHNGVPVTGATSQSLHLPRVRLDSAGTYFLRSSNATAHFDSSEAQLTVVLDDAPPRLTEAVAVTNTNPAEDELLVTFSEPLHPGTIYPSAFRLLPSGSFATPAIRSVSATSNGATWRLLVDELEPGARYYLQVSNVTDAAASMNLLSPNPSLAPVRIYAPVLHTNSFWRYLEADTNQTYAGWADIDYDTSAWLTGRSGFGLPLDEPLPPGFPVQTIIRSPSAGGPITTYFRSHFHVQPHDTNSWLSLAAVFDDGAMVHLNGSEIWRVRMPAGPVSASTFAHPEPEPHQIASTNLSGTGLLRAGTNVLAVELHQSSLVNGDAFMILGLQLGLTPPDITNCAPRLHVTRQANAVAVSWECPGRLQTSPVLGPAATWTDVEDGSRLFPIPAQGSLFFRVRSLLAP